MSIKALTDIAQQHTVFASSTVSVGSVVTSFVASTLPFVQYIAAVIAAVSGIFAILVAWKRLRK